MLATVAPKLQGGQRSRHSASSSSMIKNCLGESKNDAQGKVDVEGAMDGAIRRHTGRRIYTRTGRGRWSARRQRGGLSQRPSAPCYLRECYHFPGTLSF